MTAAAGVGAVEDAAEEAAATVVAADMVEAVEAVEAAETAIVGSF